MTFYKFKFIIDSINTYPEEFLMFLTGEKLIKIGFYKYMKTLKYDLYASGQDFTESQCTSKLCATAYSQSLMKKEPKISFFFIQKMNNITLRFFRNSFLTRS